MILISGNGIKRRAEPTSHERLDELFMAYSGLVDYSKEVLAQLKNALYGIPIGVAIRHWLINTSHMDEHAEAFLSLMEAGKIPLRDAEGQLLSLGHYLEGGPASHQSILAAIKTIKKKTKAEKEQYLQSYRAFAAYLDTCTLGIISIT
jgi:hypothetical protein